MLRRVDDLDAIEGAYAFQLATGQEGKCAYCAQDGHVRLFEAWGARHFALDTCCEASHEMAVEILDGQDRESAELLRAMGAEMICGDEVRRTVDDGCGGLVIDWMPRICSITQKEAKAFVNEHHEHCDASAGWKFGMGLRNGRDLIGVAMVGRPVARMIDHTEVIEVNRLCIRRDMAPGLRWNGCSMLYGAAAKKARKMGYVRMVTYTLEDESGASLVASGWTFDGYSRGGRWSREERKRADAGPLQRKVRWVKQLRKKAGPTKGQLQLL